MPDNSTIITQTFLQESAGLTPMEASRKIIQTNAPSISTSTLSNNLTEIFAGITANELAVILHKHFSDSSALDIAKAIKEALPNTDRLAMYNALTGANFSELDAHAAVNLIFEAKTIIDSSKPWQQTEVFITNSQITEIFCFGEWSFDPARSKCGPDGVKGFSAPLDYTLEGAPVGAMIGQIGSNKPFLVGTSTKAPVDQVGVLSLCINDDIYAKHGMGLKDNSGAMDVRIKTTP